MDNAPEASPSRRGCLWIMIAIVALYALGFFLYAFGGGSPLYAVTIENRTSRSLAIVFSDGSSALAGLPEALPIGTTRFYRAFSRGDGAFGRISVYKGKSDTTRALCERILTGDLEAFDEGRSRLVIEPIGSGCRVAIQGSAR